jgi:hypothetical protein
MDKKVAVIQTIRTLLTNADFHARNRVKPKYFTRKRVLTFSIVLILILQKSVKSLQLVLNEFFGQLSTFVSLTVLTVSNSAFSQARQKLSHTAFIELHRTAVVENYYADDQYQTWQGFRLLGVDGSKIRLPDTPEIRKEFGVFAVKNQSGVELGEQPWALASVCYDVLNEIVLDAILAHGKAYEVDVAVKHLRYLRANDLLIGDMNYPSYQFLAELSVLRQKRGCHYLFRCSSGSFTPARELFATDERESVIVTLTVPKDKRREIKRLGLPQQITVRFVRVILDDGTVEVLVTSLIDERRYPTSLFKELYNLRWGVETLYDRIKNLLSLENFSGTTVEAVKQDFYATIFICGLEAILTEDASDILESKTPQNQYPQQVNKMVSFNTIKNHVIALLFSEEPASELCAKLTRLFLTNPVCVRKDRQVARKKTSPRAALHYQKRKRKFCY